MEQASNQYQFTIKSAVIDNKIKTSCLQISLPVTPKSVVHLDSNIPDDKDYEDNYNEDNDENDNDDKEEDTSNDELPSLSSSKCIYQELHESQIHVSILHNKIGVANKACNDISRMVADKNQCRDRQTALAGALRTKNIDEDCKYISFS